MHYIEISGENWNAQLFAVDQRKSFTYLLAAATRKCSQKRLIQKFVPANTQHNDEKITWKKDGTKTLTIYTRFEGFLFVRFVDGIHTFANRIATRASFAAEDTSNKEATEKSTFLIDSVESFVSFQFRQNGLHFSHRKNTDNKR